MIAALRNGYPEDIQANRAFLNESGESKADLRKRYKARFEAEPDNPLRMYFYALTLVGNNTRESIRLLKSALKKPRN